jgi:(5-formylfuran-3-yl)methyl phosphate synthase
VTKLLVSVRSAAEAELALAGGADFIDVKEPERGPLGRADFEIIRDVIERVAGRAQVSAALGELVDWRANEAARLPAGLDYVKFGLEGCGLLPAWRECWRQTVESLPAEISVVPVAYADHRAAVSPRFEDVIETAAQCGAEAVLMDTFDKRGPGLLDVRSAVEVSAFISSVQAADMKALVAGKLDQSAFPQIVPLEPDVIGVRGAVCDGGRSGRLDTKLVRQLATLLQATDSPNQLTSDRR